MAVETLSMRATIAVEAVACFGKHVPDRRGLETEELPYVVRLPFSLLKDISLCTYDRPWDHSTWYKSRRFLNEVGSSSNKDSQTNLVHWLAALRI